MSDKTTTLDKILALFDKSTNKSELKLIKEMCILATETDDVRKYNLRLTFFVQVLTITLSLTVIYLLGRLLIEYSYGARFPYV